MNTKIEKTTKALSSLGGIHFFKKVIEYLGLDAAVGPHLPVQKIASRSSSFDKFQALCLGLVAGAECLDDMERLGRDPGFAAFAGHVNAANTYGDWLRKFDESQIRELNLRLTETAFKLRAMLVKKPTDFILDIDSTSHRQCGDKIEGAAYNYKGEWCLDSLVAYDQFGLQYWAELRPGATFTSNGAPTALNEILKRVPKSRLTSRYVRADSGFCNIDFFNTCFHANAKFVCAMRQNMFAPLIRRATNWRRAKKVTARDGRACEISHTLYYPAKGHKALRLVLIRAQKPDVQNAALFDDARYDYYAWLTDIGHHEMTNEEVILFYRGRGHAENFIREWKNGFDMHHLPCLKLSANKAYDLIAAFAYNMTRFMAFTLDPRKPRFAKTIRFRMVNLACQVVRHARTLTLRFHPHVHEEVTGWLKTIHIKFGFA